MRLLNLELVKPLRGFDRDDVNSRASNDGTAPRFMEIMFRTTEWFHKLLSYFLDNFVKISFP